VSAARRATRSPRRVELTWASWAKLVAVVAAAWLFLRLWPLVLVLVVAALLAIALDPVVTWLERRGLKRSLAALLIAACVVLLSVMFAELSWASLTSQGHLLAQRGKEAYAHVLERAPCLARLGADQGSAPALAGYGIRIVRSLVEAAIVAVLGFILTVYLLVDGRRTWAWLRAFVPRRQRTRIDETATAVCREVFGYVAGNVVTATPRSCWP